MPRASTPSAGPVALAAAAAALLVQACTAGAGVTPVTAAGADSLRRSSDARVVLVNVWATWCKPCLDEMPGLVRLRSEYPRADLDLVLISADDPADLDTAVVPFLRGSGVDFETWIYAGRDQDALIRGLDSSWSGALPATFLSSPATGASKTLVGERTYEQLKTAVDELLAR